MISAQVPRPFIDAPLVGASRWGIDQTTLLQRAGIALNALDNPEAGFSYADYGRFLARLWQISNDEFMGLAPTPSPYGSFAMMCKAIISCNNLEHALHRAKRFYQLFSTIPTINICRQGPLTRFEINCHNEFDPNHFLSESLLVIWHRFSSWLIGQGIPLIKVGCQYSRPAHAQLYQTLFACEVLFAEQSTYLLLPSKFLDAPISQTPASLHSFLKHSPADLLARPNPHESISGRVRQLLRQQGFAQLPNLNAAANLLDLSVATLRRRLQDENASFQQLKDEYRAEEARMLLAQQQMEIRDIAEHLGFTETSTFHRAFKKWHQLTPNEYRQQLSVVSTGNR